MRLILFIFLFSFSYCWAQNNSKAAQRDPYLQNPVKNQPSKSKPAQKVRIINADNIILDDNYDGNRYFKGNVKLEHQGSFLYADIVVTYEDENFIRAIGNVKLQNQDGSVITAEEMDYDGDTQKGVAKKKVVLTDPKGTIIKTETMYYDRISNQAYYNTGGTIFDGKTTTYSKSATYFLTNRTIDLTGRVKIVDKDYTLEGENVVQDQNSNIVTINGYTTITNNKNPKNRIITEKGTHNSNTKESFLTKNSKIFYNDKILTGDEMYHNQITGFGKATGNVTIDDPLEKRYIKGGYGEIFEKQDSAMMTKSPYAVKILEKDSIYFASEKILSYQKPDSADITKKKSYIRAFRKARIYKSNAQGRADSIAFNENDGIMHMYKDPILWSGEKQVTGDKIEAYFNTETEDIDSLKVLGNGFAIAKVDSLNLLDEFHQVKGRLMSVYYEGGDIKEIKVIGNAESITYVDEENKKTGSKDRIGVNIATCGIIGALFSERNLHIITCSIGAVAKTLPMSKISPQEKRFEDFNWNTKDRIRKWQDILVDSPNYEEIKYEPNDDLYNKIKEAQEKEKAIEEAKKPKRVRR